MYCTRHGEAHAGKTVGAMHGMRRLGLFGESTSVSEGEEFRAKANAVRNPHRDWFWFCPVSHTCVTFRVFFISGNFFNGLRQYKTPNGTEFRKKKESTTYRNFPDQLTVDVEAIPQYCTPEMPPLDYAAGLMAGASFEVAWKRGDETRPVVLLSTQERHQSLGCDGIIS